MELVFWQDGKELMIHTVWGPVMPDLATYGEQERQHHYWIAMARFLNAGGAVEDITKPLDAIAAAGRISPSDGSILFEQTIDGWDAQTVWVNLRQNKAIVFNEDESVEEMTIPELHRHILVDMDRWEQLTDATQAQRLPGASAETPD